MLVLSRREKEAIIIDGNIKIVVIEMKGNKVKIGIEAPKHVVIDREEVVTAKENGDRNANKYKVYNY